MEQKVEYTHRFIARIEIETTTPLAVGSGAKDILTDAMVALDCNNLPYIPGSAVAGILRHALSETDTEAKVEDIFGKQDGDIGWGSRIIFSEARMLDEKGIAMDGLRNLSKGFEYTAIRQHNAITDKGITKDGAKYDCQVVLTGTRFVFEVEMFPQYNQVEEDEKNFKQILNLLQQKHIRFGGGTRKGYGAIKITSCFYRHYNLTLLDDRNAYMDKYSSLAEPFIGGQPLNLSDDTAENVGWDCYQLILTPDDFFMFGSGLGDEDADDTPLTERRVKNGCVSDKATTIIPASSIKGALSHRVAYYYNRLCNCFADSSLNAENKPTVGDKNPAVAALFGEGTDGKNGACRRGRVIISDVFLNNELQTKKFNHVKIDRFTGGAIAGALYNEKANYGADTSFTITILVDRTAFDTENVEKAFQHALLDICEGLLPLGGMVNRGHGCFHGELKRNGIEITKSNLEM